MTVKYQESLLRLDTKSRASQRCSTLARSRDRWYPHSRKPYVGINDPRIYAESQAPSTSLARDPISGLPSYSLDKERSVLLSATHAIHPAFYCSNLPPRLSTAHPAEPILPLPADRRTRFLFPTPINTSSNYQDGRQVSLARRV